MGKKNTKALMHPSKRFFWADLIRTIAIILVVMVHSITLPDKWTTIPLDWWLSSIFYNTLGHMAVPMFVMLSGALLLGKEESYRQFFSKRVIKIMIRGFPGRCYLSFGIFTSIVLNLRILQLGSIILPVSFLVSFGFCR